MRSHSRHLRIHVPLREFARMPAQCERETVSVEQRTERRRIARELPTDFHALVANCRRIAKAGFQRYVLTEAIQHVICPGQGAHGKTNVDRQGDGFLVHGVSNGIRSKCGQQVFRPVTMSIMASIIASLGCS